MMIVVVICFTLLRHRACWALALADASAGRSIAARIAMMAITTKSSINVNPWAGVGFSVFLQAKAFIRFFCAVSRVSYRAPKRDNATAGHHTSFRGWQAQ